ncbi:MAG: hypothetical protein M3279_02715, partial [Actinomycetota bacterium]|nr:hypothetical protein [Actinomycetota bacterium]
MDEMVACPDCGTPNRAEADLCIQCWRALKEDAVSRIPVVALAAPAPLPPPPLPTRTVQVQTVTRPEPVAVREATP